MTVNLPMSPGECYYPSRRRRCPQVLYRAAMALIVLLHKQTAHQPCRDKAGRWATLLEEQPVQNVMRIFCQEIPVSQRQRNEGVSE